MGILGIFAYSFGVGTLLYVFGLPAWASIGVFSLSVGGVLSFLYLPKGKGKYLRLVALGMALGLLWSYIYEIRQIRPMEQLNGEDIQLQVTALEDQEDTDYGCKVLCKYGDSRILVYIFDCEVPIYAGNVIQLKGTVEAPTAEEGLAYLAKDVDLTAGQAGEITVTAGEKTLRNLPARVYGNVRRRITELFPEDTAPFALALLTGDTGKLSYGFRNQMSLAGVSHVVAVSGMHVSLICAMVLNLCLRRKRLAAGLCLGAIWFFGAMLGFSPSVTRAVIMNSVLLMAPILKREYDSLTALGFALLILLIKNPFSVASPGLQLSFASVSGIILLSTHLSKKLQSVFPDRLRERRFLWWGSSFLTTSLATTVGASIFTVPLVAYYFGTVSLISFVSNLILLPLITVIFSLGYPLVILSYFTLPLAQTLADFVSVPIRWVVAGIEFLGELPYGVLYSRSIYVILWLVVAYVLIAMGIRQKRKVLAFALTVGLLVSVPFLRNIHIGDFRFTMLDVGQGQCLLAEIGDSVTVIDCGGSREDDAGEEAVRELLSHGRKRIHALILTHYDLDHSGGVLQLMDRMPVDRLYLPDISPENTQREKILQKAEEKQVSVIWVKEEISLQMDGGSLQIFPPITTKNENDGLSLLLSGADYDILVTGDLSVEMEQKLIQREALPDLEILIAGHHGAANSTGQVLLEHTMPEELLISVGENSYGHPDPTVLERAKNLGIRIRRTDQEGTITITR